MKPFRINPSAQLALLVAMTAIAVGLALAPDTPSSGANFAASKSNPSNSFTAAQYFQSQTASGTYVGNATDNRNINTLSFQPNFVIIKATTNQGAVIRTSTMSGDATKALFGNTALVANRIQSLLANGFQVGTDNTVNQTGTTYQWFAGTTDPGTVSAGTYTGNGGASRAITGLGYSPEAVLMLSAGAQIPLMRLAPMTASFRFESGTGTAAAINSLDADGFTVGNSTSTNQNATAYHWIAFNDTAGLVDVSSYAGNGAASQSIAGLGFSPAMTLVRSGNTGTARAGVWRPTAITGAASAQFAAAANDANAITALGANGFTVGNNTNANANGTTYSYLALDAP